MIPSFELRTQYQQLKSEILEAVSRVLEKGQFILGPEVDELEKEFARWNGSPHAVGVASGTDALHLALRALDVHPDDEVICPPFTYMATASAVSLVGAKPVFVDIVPSTFTLDPAKLEAAITPKTKAVIAVHLYGQAADIAAIQEICKKHKLALIEDCAQSTGTEIKGVKVGNFGDIGCFSFFPTKNLGACGDGGMMTTNDPKLAEKIRKLRQQGQGPVKYTHEVLGTNSRLDELQAAILRIKLRHLDKWNDSRRNVAAEYARTCKNPAIQLPQEAPGTRHVYHQYTVRCQDRPALMEHLKTRGIGCTVYYPVCLHLQPAYSWLGLKKGSFPVSEQAQEQALSLPMYPELTPAQISEICEALNQFQPSLV